MKALSIVIPVLDDAPALDRLLAQLQPERGPQTEVIVVDGGSRDRLVAVCAGRVDRLLAAPPGRARQMNAGATAARGRALWFLHADSHLPPDAVAQVLQALRLRFWGRFDVHIEGRSRWLPVVASLMNLRSRLSGIATRDQAMLVRRDVFQRLGGFADQPLMEDIELSRRLRAVQRPACLHARVVTSGRRWDSRGAWPTIVLMWRLRWRYWRGVAPDELAKAYR